MWGQESGKAPKAIKGQRRDVRDESLAMASLATRRAEEHMVSAARKAEEEMREGGWTLCSRLNTWATVWEKGGRFVVCVPGAALEECTP